MDKILNDLKNSELVKYGQHTSSIQHLNNARACGHKNLSDFNYNDITTWKREMAELSGIKFAGVMR